MFFPNAYAVCSKCLRVYKGRLPIIKVRNMETYNANAHYKNNAPAQIRRSSMSCKINKLNVKNNRASKDVLTVRMCDDNHICYQFTANTKLLPGHYLVASYGCYQKADIGSKIVVTW